MLGFTSLPQGKLEKRQGEVTTANSPLLRSFRDLRLVNVLRSQGPKYTQTRLRPTRFDSLGRTKGSCSTICTLSILAPHSSSQLP